MPTCPRERRAALESLVIHYMSVAFELCRMVDTLWYIVVLDCATDDVFPVATSARILVVLRWVHEVDVESCTKYWPTSRRFTIR